ncbi:MAG: C40 family peptidase [Spirulina sp.]
MTAPATDDIHAIQKRQVELLEQLLRVAQKNRDNNEETANAAGTSSDVIELGIIWAIIGLCALVMAVQALGAQISQSRAGQWLGLGQANPSVNAVAPSGGSALGQTVATKATAWVGRDFKPRQTERCADFVRVVLQEAGIAIPTAKGSAGPLMADSFFGPELGQIILDPTQLQPGDIVMFHETYNGGGRVLPGADGRRKVTHVGVYIGQGQMVDRSTRSAPVRQRSIHTDFNGNGRSNFHSALRPTAYGSGGGGSTQGGVSLDRLRRVIIGHESSGNFRAVNPDSGALGYGQVMPNNLPAWSRAALGREVSRGEFLNSPAIQIAIINHRLGLYLAEELAQGHDQDTAIRRVASRWYSGRPHLYNNTGRQFYGGREYPSIDAYTRSILAKYNAGL